MRIEQAAYGSFPFWDRGYAVLARSPGCRDEWLAEFRAACEHLGQRPREAAEVRGLIARRLESGPWLVAAVRESGPDDRGRPGALAFHGLFLSPRDYRRLGAWPFALMPFHRDDWHPDDADRPLETLDAEPMPFNSHGSPPSPEAGRIAAAIAKNRRVAVESATPIDALAREVWRALAVRARQRASLATLAFAPAEPFSLVGVPRRAALDPSHGYLDPADLEPRPAPPRRDLRRLIRPVALLAASIGLATAALLFALAAAGSKDELEPPPTTPATPAPPVPTRPADTTPSPDPSRYPPEPADPELTRRVADALNGLASRFGIRDADTDRSPAPPSTIMAVIASRLRYRGPLLSPAERAALADEPGPGRSRALAWDAHVRRFLPDRPLPPGFASGPLRWQLDTLAWSFHLDPDPTLAPAEVPDAMGHALAVDASLAPNPLTDRYPALADYARFLARLPRR